MSEKNEKLTKAAKEIKLSEEQLENTSGGKKHDESHEYDNHPQIFFKIKKGAVHSDFNEC
ncbi:hypothetical protein [Clostridium thailandense]|uniref:hypothetical protein n=1 Tax=Clostridium thailandense TaxID=2794346 RepID=UPI003989D6B9